MRTFDGRLGDTRSMTIAGIDDQAGPDAYRAGACNIGPAEIARRRRAGITGLIAAMVLAVALLLLDAPASMRLAVALPLGGGLVSLEQVRKRFCVGFAMAGLRNFGPLGREERIEDAAARAADRRAAIRLALPPAVLGIGLAIAFALLPI